MKDTTQSASAMENHLFPIECSCARLRRTTRAITQAYDRALKPAGVRVTQYSVLANLDGRDAISVGDLADRLVMDRTTLTRNLRPMAEAGWIAIAGGSDRRSREVRITATGRARLKEARPLWRAAERALREALGPSDVAALHRLLDAAARLVADHGKPAG